MRNFFVTVLTLTLVTLLNVGRSFIYFLLQTFMARSHKRASQAFWDAIEDNENDDVLQTTIKFTHTELNLDESGPSSLRTFHLATLASPTKKSKRSEQDTGSWITEPQPGSVDFSDDLDPAYTMQHFERHVEPPPAQKKKISGVSYFLLIAPFRDIISS